MAFILISTISFQKYLHLVMSQNKSASNNCDSSNDTNDNIISSDLRVQLNQIIKDFEHQNFFDPSLSNEHILYILNNRFTIENEFIDKLNNRIQGLDIDPNIRQRLIANLDKFRTYYILIDNTSDITNDVIFNYPFHYDSDQDSYVDDSTSDIYSDDDNDLCDDLENLILDQIEFEHDMAAFCNNYHGNQNQHTTDNDDNEDH